MTQQFASIELARLYESQGYLEDALSMYKALGEDTGGEESEVGAAIHRLEASLAGGDKPAPLSGDGDIKKTIAELSGQVPDMGEASYQALDPELEPASEFVSSIQTDGEKRIARLLDKWLMLMVVQKRVKLFKAIGARL